MKAVIAESRNRGRAIGGARGPLAVLVLFLLAALGAPAQEPGIPSYQDLKYAPMPALKLPKVETYTLSNGMKLYLLENHELPLVSGSALVRTGNLFDPPGKVGLAGITGEVMRTGGTKTKTGDQLDEELENIAASVESSIGETSGSVGFSCLKENTGEVLAVFEEILTEPEFRQDKIDLSITQERSVISRRNDDAGGIASREFTETIYGKDTPYGWRTEYEHLDHITRADLVAFHKRYFFPANVMLSIQGDFDAAEMKAKLEKLFADWKVTQPPVPEFPKVTAKPDHRVYFATKEDVNQTSIRMGHLGGMLNDPDYAALEVMSDILGGGFSSRLFRKIRTELGYAYGIGSSWGAAYDHPGIFRVAGSTKSASTVATIRATLAEVKRIRTGEVSDQELKTAKDKVLNSFVFAFDSPGKTLRRIVRYEYFGYPKDFIFKYQQAIRNVSKADVLRVAKQRLKPENFTIVAVGNPKQFDQPLSALGIPVKKIDLTIPEPKQASAASTGASLTKGKAILAKLQQAVGGAGKLAAVKDYTQVANVVLTTPRAPGGKLSVKQTKYWLSPTYYRQVQQMPFGAMTAYFDGQKGWLKVPQGFQPMPPPVIKQLKSALMRLPWRLWLADRQEGWKVNAVADNAVEITGDDGMVVRLEIDTDSGLPAKVDYQTVQMAGAPAKLQDTPADWREVDGVKVPFKITITRAGAPYADVTVQEVKLNSGITAEEIAKQQ